VVCSVVAGIRADVQFRPRTTGREEDAVAALEQFEPDEERDSHTAHGSLLPSVFVLKIFLKDVYFHSENNSENRKEPPTVCVSLSSPPAVFVF
jgi:hypothetical protein